jgi:hypothetical protein
MTLPESDTLSRFKLYGFFAENPHVDAAVRVAFCDHVDTHDTTVT